MPLHDAVARLIVALDQRNDVVLAGLLSRDVRFVVDSGDETGCEVHGRAAVARELSRRMAMRPDAALHAAHVNGAPGLALRREDGEVVGVLALEGASKIERMWLSTAPAKLAAWNRRRPEIDLD